MRTAQQTDNAPATGVALDIGRGLAIFAVIYGHAMAPWFMDAGAHFSEAAFQLWRFGASFMMPFFFFVSGLAWRAEKTLWATVRESMTLVFIAIGASLVLDLFRVAITYAGFAEAIAQPTMTIGGFFANAWRMAAAGDLYSLSALWFLTALAGVRFVAAFSSRFGAWGPPAAALALFGLYVVMEARGARNYLQLELLWVGFAAFMAGRWARGAFDKLETRPNLALALMIPAAALAAVVASMNHGCTYAFERACTLSFLNDRFGVSMFMAAFGYLPIFVLGAAIGIVFASSLSIFISHRGGVVAVAFKRWGRNSLNLLIVNAAFLELANPLLSRDVVPRVHGDNPLFFVVLFAVAIVANVMAAGLLRPALSRLRLSARDLAMFIVDVARGRVSCAPKRAPQG